MGAYINPENLAARYRIFDSSSASNVSSDTIFYAEKEVEQALSSVYTVPFSAPHPTITDLCIDMAFVRFQRMNKPKDGSLLDTAMKKRLKDIVSGKSPIITGSGTLLQEYGACDLPGSTTEDYHPTNSMLGAESALTRVSSELLSALIMERQ